MNGPVTGILNMRAGAAALVLGNLALGGCATSHVGNTWQCPLIEGQPCQSVRDADPAAPVLWDADISDPVVSERFGSDTARARAREAKCRSGCRPFRWLRRAFATGDGERTDTGDSPDVEDATATTAEHPQPEDSWRDGARTPEVLGRIWIAPYVDAAGVYHEASWVRVVIEPAAWRNAP